MTPMPSSSVPPEDASDESYVGLPSGRAEQLARDRGWRVVRSLPPGSIITMEYLEGRINFEVKDGTVTRCWLG
ncbi:proteinase inhibitor I78 [Streptomyces sp. NPDC015346]|uniref:proteinase inhibitor I78 n=1 Tax=Streptomyces sp. NPDC015346 TaxID=3364954 RepID=UPI0036FD7769